MTQEFSYSSDGQPSAPEVIQAGPDGLIALTWHRLGVRPLESLVLVGVSGRRRRSGLIVRADLPPADLEDDLLEHLTPTLVRSGAEGVVGLVFSTKALTGPPPSIVPATRDHATAAGLQVVDLLGVTQDAYRSYLCADTGCCSAEGHPLAGVETTLVAAELVLRGSMVAPDEQALIADVRQAPVDEGDNFEAAPEAELALSTVQRAAWYEEWLTQLSAPPTEVDRDWARQLAAALGDVRLRDALLVSLVSTRYEIARAILEGQQPDLASLSEPPQPNLVERGRQLLAASARHGEGAGRTDALASLAWVAWWTSDGARSRLLADAALSERSDHRLALLVRGLLQAAIPPPWVEVMN